MTMPIRNGCEEHSDGSLLVGATQGSNDSADALYRRYAGRISALVRTRLGPELATRLDADDLVQSTFGSFFRGLKGGAFACGPGEELWGLLAVIALNKVREKAALHRAAKRDVRVTRPIADDEEALGVASAEADEQLLQVSIRELLETLPTQHRAVILLRMDGYHVADIAELTGRSKRSVERILQECRGYLVSLLG